MAQWIHLGVLRIRVLWNGDRNFIVCINENWSRGQLISTGWLFTSLWLLQYKVIETKIFYMNSHRNGDVVVTNILWFDTLDYFRLCYENSQIYKNNPQWISKLKDEVIRVISGIEFQLCQNVIENKTVDVSRFARGGQLIDDIVINERIIRYSIIILHNSRSYRFIYMIQFNRTRNNNRNTRNYLSS